MSWQMVVVISCLVLLILSGVAGLMAIAISAFRNKDRIWYRGEKWTLGLMSTVLFLVLAGGGAVLTERIIHLCLELKC